MKKIFTIIFIYILIILPWINATLAQELQHETSFSEYRCLPGYGFKKMANPEIFQGNRKKKNYFEGWYFKMVSPDNSSILSIIPGISLSEDRNRQLAFIQIIDGKTAQTFYYTFPIEQFSFSRKEFAIKIGQNYFSKEKIILNIHTDSSFISGMVHLSEHVELPSHKILNPGIMGWYRFVPFMQCYHGVVSLTHKLEGSIKTDMKTYNFNNGTGYIEKDWGSSMPSAWIWVESTNFSKENCSFMLSVANIPWLGKSFTGFLGFFLHDSTICRFATYTHAKLQIEKLESDTVYVTIKDRKNTYAIKAFRNSAGILKAPVKGSMDRRIPESIDAKLQLTIWDKNDNIIFCDSTSIAGLEMVGDLKTLTDN